MTSDPVTSGWSTSPSSPVPPQDPPPVPTRGALTVAERRLHPAYLLISLGRTIRSLIPVIAVGVWQAPGWAIALAAGLVLLHSFALWRVRRYSVADGNLRVRGGVFRRTQDTIGLHRISALDAERGVVQRLFRVWSVKIRTPGNDHRSSVHLVCLSTAALAELRDAVGQPLPAASGSDRDFRPNRGQTRAHADQPPAEGADTQPADGADPQPADGADTQPANGADPARFASTPPRMLAVLDNRTLLLAAVTGTSVPLMLAGAVAAFGRAHDILPDRVFDHLAGEVFGGGPTTVLLILGGLVLAVMAGIGLTSLRLARFTLVRDGNRLRTTRGLIAQRAGTIPVDRVQAIRIVEGYWRRMLGYCALEVEVAGFSTSNETERTLFPLIRLTDATGLVGSAFPELGWVDGPLQAVPDRARRRYYTGPIAVALVSTVAAALLPGWWAYLAVIPLPLAVLIGHGRAADAGWSIDDATVTFRWRRVLSRHTVVARRSRVQLTEVTRTPLQRRAGLAGVRLLLSPKRRARIRHLEAAEALYLLHAVGRRTGVRPAQYRGQ